MYGYEPPSMLPAAFAGACAGVAVAEVGAALVGGVARAAEQYRVDRLADAQLAATYRALDAADAEFRLRLQMVRLRRQRGG